MIKLQRKLTGDTVKLWSAYYNGIRICSDPNLDRVEYYMQFHRKCTKKRYTLEQEEVQDMVIGMHYQDVVMDNLYGIWLPVIDINYLLDECAHLNDMMSVTVNQMAMVGLIYGKSGRTEKAKKMEAAIDCIFSTMTDPKDYHKFQKSYCKMHPLMIMPIDKYMQLMKGYKEQREMMETFKTKVLTD